VFYENEGGNFSSAEKVKIAILVRKSVEAAHFTSQIDSVLRERSSSTRALLEDRPELLKAVKAYFWTRYPGIITDTYPETQDELSPIFSKIDETFVKSYCNVTIEHTHNSMTVTDKTSLHNDGKGLQEERISRHKWNAIWRLGSDAVLQKVLACFKLNVVSDIRFSVLNAGHPEVLADIRRWSQTILDSNRLANAEESLPNIRGSHHLLDFHSTDAAVYLNDPDRLAQQWMYFSSTGMAEIPSNGVRYPHFGYQVSGDYRAMPIVTSKSVTIGIAKLTGQKNDLMARYAFLALARSIQGCNTEEMAPLLSPFATHNDLDAVVLKLNTWFKVDAPPEIKQMAQENGAELTAITWWTGPYTDSRLNQRLLNITTIGAGSVTIKSTNERSNAVYSGKNAIKGMSIPSIPFVNRHAFGNIGTWLPYYSKTYTTVDDGVRSGWVFVSSSNVANSISVKEMRRIADHFREYPVDHISHEIMKRIDGEGFLVVGRLWGRDSGVIRPIESITRPPVEIPDALTLRARRPGTLPLLPDGVTPLGGQYSISFGNSFAVQGPPNMHITNGKGVRGGQWADKLVPYDQLLTKHPLIIDASAPEAMAAVPLRRQLNLSYGLRTNNYGLPGTASTNPRLRVQFAGTGGHTGYLNPNPSSIMMFGTKTSIVDMQDLSYNPARAIAVAFDSHILDPSWYGCPVDGSMIKMDTRKRVGLAAACIPIEFTTPTTFVSINLYPVQREKNALRVVGLGDYQVLEVGSGKGKWITGSKNAAMASAYLGVDQSTGIRPPTDDRVAWDGYIKPARLYAVITTAALTAAGGANEFAKQFKGVILSETGGNLASRGLAALPQASDRQDGLLLIQT
jgi:hypothetical protein